MGIISSTVLKLAHISQNYNQVVDSSSGWQHQFEVFMKGGACKQVFMDFQDCVDNSKKKNETIGQCYPMLHKCMEAHSDYYKPIIAMSKASLNVLDESLVKTFLPSTTVSLNEINEDEDEKFVEFMKGGGCKESYTAWHDDCNFTEEEAEKNKDLVTKCAGLFGKLSKCLDVHSDYYHPILAVKKTTEEHLEKELAAFFPKES
ncbi:unnamed protein product [Arabidopsis arenosa]|uniref:GCK domain-containing protein n=1 Tax=Arabidopsis arenosa TaxID=38785 RepID=A0A8S2ADX8_ARAAE|nr:unnamed protein product [Arabidopsis arenosa]